MPCWCSLAVVPWSDCLSSCYHLKSGITAKSWLAIAGRHDFENLLSRWTQEILEKEEQNDVAVALGIAVNALRELPRPGWQSCCILRLAGGVVARNRKLLVGHLCKELLQELRSLDNYKMSGVFAGGAAYTCQILSNCS